MGSFELESDLESRIAYQQQVQGMYLKLAILWLVGTVLLAALVVAGVRQDWSSLIDFGCGFAGGVLASGVGIWIIARANAVRRVVVRRDLIVAGVVVVVLAIAAGAAWYVLDPSNEALAGVLAAKVLAILALAVAAAFVVLWVTVLVWLVVQLVLGRCRLAALDQEHLVYE